MYLHNNKSLQTEKQSSDNHVLKCSDFYYFHRNLHLKRLMIVLLKLFSRLFLIVAYCITPCQKSNGFKMLTRTRIIPVLYDKKKKPYTSDSTYETISKAKSIWKYFLNSFQNYSYTNTFKNNNCICTGNTITACLYTFLAM